MVAVVVFQSIHPPVRSAAFLVRPSAAASSSASAAAATFGRSSSLLLRPARLRAPPGALRSLVSMSPENPLVHDVCASAVTAGVALGLLRFWEELAKQGLFEQKLNRKLVHISIGLAFMLFWPLFSSGRQAPFLAAVAPGINAIRMVLMGLGILRNDAMVKSISRHGDYRELLKGPFYYACTITLATSVFWRTSPIAIAAICNLCAGDGMADIVGRRFGRHKLPYNPNKSVAGSLAMVFAGFIASVGYVHYFHSFGFINESWGMAMRFLFVSLAAAFVESLPISSELDDNLTVPFTSLVFAGLVF
ncbi:putative phytol kinase 2, chloroplastic [Cocos nucifera]|uniref:Putative phytol kinase 2, chloroplastic n=1 Tax=Cocos nucifera TaxID=13894 RepID=A0A8K0IS95_COCNU|nr:putative phytol kinase 2, chloroplastic [Cocos nucifera]